MTIRRPTRAQLGKLGDALGLGLSEPELDALMPSVDSILAVQDWVERLDGPMADARVSDRAPGWRPSRGENPLGAWYWRTDIAGDRAGPLAGKSVALKDNICVAGVPMMTGSAMLEGHVPDRDATVVTRALEAGATIAGKAVCEPFSYSGGSHLSDTGPVLNPYDRHRSSGGSSSGCAALLAGGAVDLAIGGDQAGSIRVPSSWSGVYGLKPTFGLVPHTGAYGIEMTLDHLGPMARTTADVALLLDALAGPDGCDPRQRDPRSGHQGSSSVSQYLAALSGDVAGLRIGIVREGFGWDGVSEADVDEAVRAAAHGFTSLGAEVCDVSIAWHRVGRRVTLAIACEGAAGLLLSEESPGASHHPDNDGMRTALAVGRRRHAHRLPPMLEVHAVVGLWMREMYGGAQYRKAQAAAELLASAYDEALRSADVLVMPTTPTKARHLPTCESAAAEAARAPHAHGGANTSPFNATGHPAMSIPCAVSAGLPVGMMLVGRRGADATVLRAAHAFETRVFRMPPPPPSEETG